MTAPVIIPPPPAPDLRAALISSVEVQSDAVQALRLWAYQLQLNPAKGALKASEDMLALSERLLAEVETARDALARSER